MLKPFKGRSKIPRGDITTLKNIVETVYTAKEISVISKEMVVSRMVSGYIAEPNLEKYVLDMPGKQKVFDLLLERSVWDGNEISLEALVEKAKNKTRGDLFNER